MFSLVIGAFIGGILEFSRGQEPATLVILEL